MWWSHGGSERPSRPLGVSGQKASLSHCEAWKPRKAPEDGEVYRHCVSSARTLTVASHWPWLSLRTNLEPFTVARYGMEQAQVTCFMPEP